MNVAVLSAFRNMRGRVQPYMERVAALATMDDLDVRLIAVEGDSTDNTQFELRRFAERHQVDMDLITYNHGGKLWGSVAHADRLRDLTGVLRVEFGGLREDDDVALLVECDLLWEAYDLARLARAAYRRAGGFDVLAPRIMHGDRFYDVWAFRRDGVYFEPRPPYHQALNGQEFLRLDSMGSCFAVRADAARRVELVGEDALVSWSHSARGIGLSIALWNVMEVVHP